MMTKLWGIILISFGCLAILSTLFFWPEFTSYTPGRTIEQIHAETARIYDSTRHAFYRGLLWDGGWNLIISGAIFYSIGDVLERFEKSGVIKPLSESIDVVESENDDEGISCE